MHSIAFATIKGGVGKTTLAVHTAAALADRGHTVLLMDLDPQAHASLVLGLEPGDRPCAADAFGPNPSHKLDQVVVASAKRNNLYIAPSCPRIATIERELFHWGHRLSAIPRALRTLSWEPDVVVLDTPPNRGAFTQAVLAFSDIVAAPVPAGAYALQGLAEIEAARKDAREHGGELVVAVNSWDRRTSATNAAMDEAFKDLTVPVMKNRISRTEVLNQAGLAYELVYDHAPRAPVGEELRGLANELAKRIGLRTRLRAVAGGR